MTIFKRLMVSLAALGLATVPAMAAASTKKPHASAAPKSFLPGPRTCFWFNGPFSADPYINIAYPDQAAFYWSAAFNIPKGATLSIEGSFAHARYQSFVSYDELGRAVEGLADFQMDPLPGSTNPYRLGADRMAPQRSYRVTVVDQPVSGLDTSEGRAQRDTRATINAPQNADGYQTIIYRIYANDRGTNESGGVPMPEAVLRMADGRVLRGAAACDALGSRRSNVGRPQVLNVSAENYRAIKNPPGKPATWPATYEPEWHVQHTRAETLSMFTDSHNRETKRGDGGFYPNTDNRYIRTMVSLRYGPTILIRGRAPTTPRTFNGDRKMGGGQLRYWSICSNNLFVNSRVNACLYDEHIPVDAKGMYTIVASKAKDRPRNARTECGLAWLQLPDDGDGLGDADFSLITIRHMLAEPGFKEAAQNIMSDAELPKMAGYLPKAQYGMVNLIETLYPCPLPR